MNKPLLMVFASALALSACNTSTGNNAAQEQKQGTDIGIQTGWIDKSVKPGDDFFQYANGTWIKNTAIPADRPSIGAFFIADQQREKNTRELFDEVLKSNATSGPNAMIANYYNAYLNTDAIDRAGMAPAKADLDAVAKIADKHALAAAIGSTLRADTDPLNDTSFHSQNLFGIFVTQGLATPGEQLPYIMQGGIGLPEREYYLSADPKMADIRAKYKTYVQNLLQLAGYPDPQGSAGRIMDLETKIAKAHETREENEDFAKGSQVWTRQQLEQKAPGLDWGALLNAASQCSARPRRSDFRCLGKRKRIIDIHAEVSNGVFDLGVSKQYLNSSEIAGSLIDQGSLGAAERMRSVFLGAQSNRRNPFIDQSRVLSGA